MRHACRRHACRQQRAASPLARSPGTTHLGDFNCVRVVRDVLVGGPLKRILLRMPAAGGGGTGMGGLEVGEQPSGVEQEGSKEGRCW